METTVSTTWELAIAAAEGDKRERGAPSEGPIRCIEVFLERREDLRRVTAGLGYGGADIDDILQDVSIKAMKEEQVWLAELNCYRWLVRVTINCCLTNHRQRARFVRHAPYIREQVEVTQKPESCGLHQAARMEEVEVMRAALAEMETKWLLPLTLRYFCDMTSEQIGDILETPDSTIRARLRQGRLILAKRLRQKGIGR